VQKTLKAVLLVVLVLIVWISTPTVLGWLLPDLISRGQFGDQFGSVNALFSGLAFAAFFYTVLLQQKQLDLQRNELTLQRQELAMQRDEMKASRVELSNQVKLQRAILKVNIAQIVVAASNADIEAQKLEANAKAPIGMLGPGAECENIRKISRSLRALSDKLESEIPGVG